MKRRKDSKAGEAKKETYEEQESTKAKRKIRKKEETGKERK